jgi:hypothetical protein
MDLGTPIGESLRTGYFLLREEFTLTQLDYPAKGADPRRTPVEQEVEPDRRSRHHRRVRVRVRSRPA